MHLDFMPKMFQKMYGNNLNYYFKLKYLHIKCTIYRNIQIKY
jgi:hypothetical protein